MQDHYSILGVSPTAPEKDIKKSFRRLAMKHHPDKGGDAEQFKKINEAYDILSNKIKRQEYDMSRAQQRGQPRSAPQRNPFSSDSPFGVHVSSVPFEDISAHFGDIGGIFFGEGFAPRTRANRNIDLSYEILLEEAYTGINKEIEVILPNGFKRSLSLNIPAGVKSGDRLNFRELGDNSIPNIKAGDLRVAINIASHPVFERDRNNVDLRANIAVNSINAILGTTIVITGIDKKTYNVKIPAYASHGQIIRLSKKGMPMMNNFADTYGDLYIIVNLETPQNLSQEQMSLLKQVRNSK